MGLGSFFRRLFGGADDDAELRAMRARHNIVVDEDEKDKGRQEEAKEPYSAWDDIDNMRTNFFFGSWAARKFRVVGEDKVKKQLEELEKKKREEE